MTSIADLEPPPSPNGKEMLTPPTRETWRAWLAEHPTRQEGIWVVYRKKSSILTGPDYDDLVEEALCFGWIDSQYRRVDDVRGIQWFSPRRPRGIWSATNKRRIERLTAEGRMTPAGETAIAAAKADGSWARYDEVETLSIPPDLAAALAATPGAADGWSRIPDSTKRQHLWAIASARRPITRERRIDAVIEAASGQAVLRPPIEP